MLIFFFICALMLLLALSLMLPPLLRSEADVETEDARGANLLIYRDQLRELEADVKNGLLSESQYQQDKDDVERRLLEDVAGAGTAPSTARRIATRKLAYALAAAVPVAAVLFYLAVGNPKTLEPRATNPPATMGR